MNKNDNDSTWPDGTFKSRGNAFTAHNYVPGLPAAPTPAKPRHVKGGFGTNNGTIPGMGIDPRASGLTIKRRA